ncbi:MAG: hypothetical protein NVS4B3_14490 [Gemmatimonadaceae bacterium]
MRHALRFEGGYERNFATLQPDATEYIGDDGGAHAMQPWPEETHGVRFGFMEQAGKRFFAVRVEYRHHQVLLEHPVRLEPGRHLGGKRFAAEPIAVSDESAGALLGDILDANPDQQAELSAMREEIRGALKEAPAH